MRRVRVVVVLVVSAVVATVVGVERPAAAVDGRPVDAAGDVSVRLGGDGETLVVGWEMWRGTPGSYEAVEEWVVTAPGADEVVVPASAVRAEVEGLDVEDDQVVTVTGRNAEGDGPAASGTYDPEQAPPGAVADLDVKRQPVSWNGPLSSSRV